MHPLPTPFTTAMHDLFGDKGARWLAALPTLVEACAQRWNLTVAPPFPNLTYHYVAPAVRHHAGTHEPVVLKLGVPRLDLNRELAALRHFDGIGCVRLLAAEPAQGCMLLEQLQPGTTLACLGDDDATTHIAADIMQQLHSPPPPGSLFPTVADWAQGLARLRLRHHGGTGPLPPALVAQAEQLFAELIASSAPPMLLHGDLHHDNILAAARAPWLAIDPQGVIAEPAYAVGALLRNRLPELSTPGERRRLLARRVAILSEQLKVDRTRVIGWGLAQSVLSAAWDLEDHGRVWEPTIACAEALAALF